MDKDKLVERALNVLKRMALERRDDEPDYYAIVGWPPHLRNISEDGRRAGQAAAEVFAAALRSHAQPK